MDTNRFWERDVKKLRESGASDEELEAAIRERGEGGLYPGAPSNEPGYLLRVKGKRPMRFWSPVPPPGTSATEDNVEPQLKGKEIVDRVRSIFAIPLPKEAPDDGSLEAWTSDDLDLALKHAVTDRSIVGVMSQIQKLKGKIATTNELQAALEASWPPRHSEPANVSGRLAYTIEVKPGTCSIWIGTNAGGGVGRRKATLSGRDLIDRVRKVLLIGRCSVPGAGEPAVAVSKKKRKAVAR